MSAKLLVIREGCANVGSRVFLNATNVKALDKVSMDELKMFAADKEA